MNIEKVMYKYFDIESRSKQESPNSGSLRRRSSVHKSKKYRKY